jgi:hypothetical protein
MGPLTQPPAQTAPEALYPEAEQRVHDIDCSPSSSAKDKHQLEHYLHKRTKAHSGLWCQSDHINICSISTDVELTRADIGTAAEMRLLSRKGKARKERIRNKKSERT